MTANTVPKTLIYFNIISNIYTYINMYSGRNGPMLDKDLTWVNEPVVWT